MRGEPVRVSPGKVSLFGPLIRGGPFVMKKVRRRRRRRRVRGVPRHARRPPHLRSDGVPVDFKYAVAMASSSFWTSTKVGRSFGSRTQHRSTHPDSALAEAADPSSSVPVGKLGRKPSLAIAFARSASL